MLPSASSRMRTAPFVGIRATREITIAAMDRTIATRERVRRAEHPLGWPIIVYPHQLQADSYFRFP